MDQTERTELETQAKELGVENPQGLTDEQLRKQVKQRKEGGESDN